MSTGNTTPPPVFPQTDATHIGDGRGLTLRDYFAAHALAGLAMHSFLRGEVDEVVDLAWELANRMMEARDGR